MKILFFIDCLSAGGKERRLVELMKKLKLKQDVQFELIVMRKDIDYHEVFDLHIKIHYLIRSTKKDLTIFNKLYKICKKYAPDIIHCWDGMTAIYCVPITKLLNIKMVNGMVVDTPVNRNVRNKNWLRARLTFPFSNVIIGNSKAGLEAYKAPAKKSICIYNGVDLDRFKQVKSPSAIRKEIFGDENDDFFVVGMVAAFENRKDYNTVIKSTIPLFSKNDRIRFIFVGNGTNFSEIKNSVKPLLSDKIFFLGKRSDVESVINIFNVGVLLTNSKVHGEGISNSIIEYMALGKPVIATLGGGTNEIVINNQNGYLIDKYSEEQLIEKIEILLKNNSLIDEFGEKGKKMVHDKFDINIMTNHYIDVYSKLLKKKRE